MLRKLLIVGVVALACAPAATAARPGGLLTAGVTYSRVLEFTRHGPIVLHVMTTPKPSGLYTLEPVLSNGVVPGRETVSAMQRRLATTATAAGVNGGAFTSDGVPNGAFFQDGIVKAAPHPGRVSIGVDAAGTVQVRRVTLLSTWQGSNQRRPIIGVNRPPGPNGVTLYTPAWGGITPRVEGTIEVVVIPFPAPTPQTDLRGQIVQVNPSGGGTPIPANGAVLVGRGGQGARLAAEATPGQTVSVRLILNPFWPGIADAIGGGPELVRGGRPVFRAAEEFSMDLLSLREARTAVGQRRDGRLIFVATDGDQPGYSVGMTNFELAQAIVRLGAVTGAALEGGPATTMAFDGELLNRPSLAGRELPVADGLFLLYHGVHAPEPEPRVLSPNKDLVDDRQLFRYKLPRPARVTVRLVGPDGGVRYTEMGAKARGWYQVPWSGTKPDGTLEPEGRWRWSVSAVDELNRASSIEQPFSLNTTLGFLSVRSGRARFQLARPALVTATFETASGVVLATPLRRRALPVGAFTAAWNGRVGGGKRAPRGRYTVRVVAANALGRAELARTFSR